MARFRIPDQEPLLAMAGAKIPAASGVGDRGNRPRVLAKSKGTIARRPVPYLHVSHGVFLTAVASQISPGENAAVRISDPFVGMECCRSWAASQNHTPLSDVATARVLPLFVNPSQQPTFTMAGRRHLPVCKSQALTTRAALFCTTAASQVQSLEKEADPWICHPSPASNTRTHGFQRSSSFRAPSSTQPGSSPEKKCLIWLRLGAKTNAET